MIERQNRQKSPAKRFLFIFGIFMFFFYLALGIAIMFVDRFSFGLEKTYRVAFGIFLISYALLRLVRVLQSRRD